MVDFVRDGDIIQYNGAAVSAGDVVVVAEKVAVAFLPIALNVDGSLKAKGVFLFPKEPTTDTFDAGDKVYWDVADQEVTADADAGTNKLVGYTTQAAIATDANVECYLVNNVA